MKSKLKAIFDAAPFFNKEVDVEKIEETCTYTITEMELVNAEMISNHPKMEAQVMLRILKEKGAPIEGEIWLNIKPGWEVRRYQQIDSLGVSLAFLFVKQKKLDS